MLAIKNHYRRCFFLLFCQEKIAINFISSRRIASNEVKSHKREFFCRLIIKLKITSIDGLLETVKLVNCHEDPKSICSFSVFSTLVVRLSLIYLPSSKVTRDSRKQFKYLSSWKFCLSSVQASKNDSWRPLQEQNNS